MVHLLQLWSQYPHDTNYKVPGWCRISLVLQPFFSSRIGRIPPQLVTESPYTAQPASLAFLLCNLDSVGSPGQLCYDTWLCWHLPRCFPWSDKGCRFWGEAEFSSFMSKVTWAFEVIFVAVCRISLPSLSSPFPTLPTPCSLEGSHSAQPTLRKWELIAPPLPLGKCLHRLFGIFLQEKLLSSFPFMFLLHHLFISTWTLQFLLGVIMQYYFILFLKFFQFWPLETHTIGPCVPDHIPIV